MSDLLKQEQGAKKERKSPNTYVILFVVTAAVALLTWFVPGGAYELDEAGHAIAGTFSEAASNPQGIWDVFMASIIGMVGGATTSAAISISLSIMLFGSLLQMVEETGAIKAFLGKLAGNTKGGYHMIIAILTFVMAAFGSMFGCYEEGIIYFMMFVPAILSTGLDIVVAAMIVILGTQVGCLASTVNPFGPGVASGIAGISSGEGLLLRVIMFVVLTALVIFIICRYADKVHKDPTISTQYFRRDQDVAEFVGGGEQVAEPTAEQKRTLILFVLTFIIMVFALVPYDSINPEWTFFVDFISMIRGIPVLGWLIGNFTPFGWWYFNEISFLALVMSLLIGIANRYNVDKIIDIIIKGAAGLVPTALVVPMARGIQVVMDAGNITPTILHLGETTLAALPPMAFLVLSLLFYLFLSCFIPSSTGLSAATMTIMASLARFAGVPVHLMVTIMCMALGMAKMFTPTSIVVMTVTSTAHISYTDWLKKALPIVGLLFLCNVGFLFIGLMMG